LVKHLECPGNDAAGLSLDLCQW